MKFANRILAVAVCIFSADTASRVREPKYRLRISKSETAIDFLSRRRRAKDGKQDRNSLVCCEYRT
jgi:hypothetical protein